MDALDRLLTVDDLAEYLDVPVATIYAWRYRRQGPPGFRVGRHLRFRQRDVEDWIVEQLRRDEGEHRDMSAGGRVQAVRHRARVGSARRAKEVTDGFGSQSELPIGTDGMAGPMA